MCCKKEPYPVEILPQKVYKRRLSIDRLLKQYKGLMVVRQVEGEESLFRMETEDGVSILRDTVFGTSMANLSLNLAGGIFNVDREEHLRFLPTSPKAEAPWEGGQVNPDIVSDSENYSFCSPCFGLCFLVNTIHERSFPFFKHFDSQAERDEYEQLAISATTAKEKEYDAHLVGAFESKHNNVVIRPRTRINHAPTNANYWHVTLDTYRPTDIVPISPYEKQNSSDKKLFKALKQDLIHHCTVDSKPDYKISRHSYVKWPYCLCHALSMNGY